MLSRFREVYLIESAQESSFLVQERSILLLAPSVVESPQTSSKGVGLSAVSTRMHLLRRHIFRSVDHSVLLAGLKYAILLL